MLNTVSFWPSEVDCGPPPHLPHTHMLWNKSSRMGAEVFYQCNYGYHSVGEGNVSACAATGQWEKPGVVCEGKVKITFRIISAFKTAGLHQPWCVLFIVETSCGRPPVIESTEQVWNNNSSPGSTVVYFCKEGFYKKQGENISICNEKGQWSVPSLVCKGISDIFCLPQRGIRVK